jgi:hypothetical protein
MVVGVFTLSDGERGGDSHEASFAREYPYGACAPLDLGVVMLDGVGCPEPVRQTQE